MELENPFDNNGCALYLQAFKLANSPQPIKKPAKSKNACFLN